MNSHINFSLNRRSKLLRAALVLGTVLFCLVALLQMPNVSPISAKFTESKEVLTIRSESTFIPTPFPIEHYVIANSKGISDIVAADLDGDGDFDIISGSVKNDGFTWWENKDGKDIKWIPHFVTGNYFGTMALEVDNLDEDNETNIDIVGATKFSQGIAQAIVSWRNDGTSTNFQWSEELITLTNTWKIQLVNMDQDNDLDILSAAWNGNITWWENPVQTGNRSTWIGHTIANINNNEINALRGIYATNLECDDSSRIDVLSASSYGNNIIWWKNNGKEPEWSPKVVSTHFPGARVIYAAQLNNSNCLEIIAGGNNGIAVWKKTGSNDSNWTQFGVDTNFTNTNSIIVADLDKDQDLDILGAGEEGIAWWENLDGVGSNWNKHLLDSTFSEGKVVRVADINRDSYPDILAVVESSIIWWQLVPDAPELYPIEHFDLYDNYKVTWFSPQEVVTYTLQEDDNSSFFDPTIYIITDTLYYTITEPKAETVYYRVQASNLVGHSPWSNIIQINKLYIPIILKAPSVPPTPIVTNTPKPTLTQMPKPTPRPTCIAMEYEPNNSLEEADNNPLACEEVEIAGRLPTGDESDYYKIVVSGSGILKVELTNIPEGTDYDLYLYDSSGPPPIAKSENNANKSEYIEYAASPRAYYLRIYARLKNSNEEYSLKWQLTSR